jgi:hypothetical protein
MSEKYDKMILDLMQDGIWNVEMADFLPLATANLLQRNITIYSSRLHNPVINIMPDIDRGTRPGGQVDIKLAYLAVRGREHYDACIRKRARESTQVTERQEIPDGAREPRHLPNTPEKPSVSVNECATPRKAAEYVSPKKVKSTRKRVRNIHKWKKTIRKQKRNTGQAYMSAAKSKKLVASKQVQPSNCRNCKNKCTETIKEETRQEIFNFYYNESMTFERKHDFICQHVELRPTSKRYGRSRKHESRSFYLPVGTGKIRVCKQFFLRTLAIGDKLVRCTLAKKGHGTYTGTDQRGKHIPGNKTDDARLKHVKEHIESFPVVESHYRRKSTSRQFLAQELSVRKMYDLYQLRCQTDGVKHVSEKIYRDVFCKEFNLSFHKPKKDACQTCL